MAQSTKENPKETRKAQPVFIRPETRDKFDRIAAAKRWTLTETADALADHFLATDPQMIGDLPAVGQHLDVSA